MPTNAGRAGPTGAPAAADLEQAYRICERLAREHYENFPVASKLLQREKRRALAAVYAFARQADDFADEGYGAGGPTIEERLRALDAWKGRLDDACSGIGHSAGRGRSGEAASSGGGGGGSGTRTETRTGVGKEVTGPAGFERISRPGPARRGASALDAPHADAIFLALADTIERHDIPPALFRDLISAFRQDVTVTEYATRADLLDYCRRSADPVGRIVLAVHGVVAGPELPWSDAVCTGLQLANFWQDAGVDRGKGRIYLPLEDRGRLGVRLEDLDGTECSPALRTLLREEVAWARGFFEAGRPLLAQAPGRLRLYLRLVWHGGMRILEMIDMQGGEVLARRPKLGKGDWVRILARAALAVSAP